MSSRWFDAHGLVKLGLYTSIHAVHRAAKKGEIPPATRFGARFLWSEARLAEYAREREGDTAFVEKPRKIIRRGGV